MLSLSNNTHYATAETGLNVCVCVEASHCLAYTRCAPRYSPWTHVSHGKRIRLSLFRFRFPCDAARIKHYLGVLFARIDLFCISLYWWARAKCVFHSKSETNIVLCVRALDSHWTFKSICLFAGGYIKLVYKLFWRRMFSVVARRESETNYRYIHNNTKCITTWIERGLVRQLPQTARYTCSKGISMCIWFE